LQYLGKTSSKNPNQYRGSGTRWTNHINKHGYLVKTDILKECSSNEEVRYWGEYYSKLWNVVESKDWANLKPEYGEGGDSGGGEIKSRKISVALLGKKQSAVHVNNRRTALTNRQLSNEHKNNIRKAQTGRKLSPAHSTNISKAKTGVKQKTTSCPHCNKTGGASGMKRYHFDSCKSITATSLE
jgi:hypothetical protein